MSGVNVKAVAGGADYSLALTSTGAVYAWGDNTIGELGNGTTTNALTALLVSFPANGSATVVSISAGYDSSFALESDGSLWAWGDNIYGPVWERHELRKQPDAHRGLHPHGRIRHQRIRGGPIGSHSLAIVTAVPEPGSLGLVIGVAGAAMLRRFIKRKLR